jgi:hypothetical protein
MTTRTPQWLGNALAAHAITFQVSAAMLGSAALPSLAGCLTQRLGLNTVSTASVVIVAVLFLLHERLLFRDRWRPSPEH